MVYGSLFDDSMCLVKVSNLWEMGKEVSPHHVVLVYVRTLDLAHCDEVICQEQTIVIAYTSYFTEALIWVVEQFFTKELQILRLFCQHVLKSFLLIFQ